MSDLRILTDSVAEVLKNFKGQMSVELETVRGDIAAKDAAIQQAVADLVALRKEVREQKGDIDLTIESRVAALHDTIGENEQRNDGLEKAQSEQVSAVQALETRIDEAIDTVKASGDETRKQLEQRLDDIREEIVDLDDFHKDKAAKVETSIGSLQKLMADLESIHDGILLREKLIEAGQWEDGIYRQGDLVTHNIGQHFEAQEDTSAAPGDDDTWERIGNAGLRWVGGL